VFGLQKTAAGVSPTVSSGMVLTSLIGFTLVYGILAAALIYLFVHFIRKGSEAESNSHQGESRHTFSL
jgi:cytochrome d ubiquinol oxidase subunit I